MDTPKHHILAIDDDLDVQSLLKLSLRPEFRVTTVGSTIQALAELSKKTADFDLILSDVTLLGMTGVEIVEDFRKSMPQIPIILMTAHGHLQNAVKAMKSGAFDYVLKPLNLDELKLSLEHALRVRTLENENSVLRNEVKGTWKFENIVGKSDAIRPIFDLVQRIAPTHANVMITGETGTGKEVIARAIHNLSPRAKCAFIPINCSAIPSELLESELFGHVKGAFTGAHQDKRGLFDEARGGTIFLDEIGDMPVSLQAKLLRVVQERTVKPVGSNKNHAVDIRIVAATHKDLRKAIREGLFREDLYYRLCVIPVALPALRQRKDDILPLAEHFLRKHLATHGLKIAGFMPRAIAKLIEQPWPGNVRELENTVERAAILCTGQWITEDDIPSAESSVSSGQFLDAYFSEPLPLHEIEKRYIQLILRKTGTSKEQAAQILGIDRKTLYRKEKEYGLEIAVENPPEIFAEALPPTA
ncbi:MAG: sigma-54-dependent Fis family transcriptional regulator [Deltaproteobacteria bacterium]|nr:sigma-54-dependent Fis family transcriptional regulator [Deltaproteobacteria bacterium]